MIKLIVGTKGSGKTKAMIDQINDAVKTSKGNVVVVEKGMKLTYDIAPAARLIDLDEYKISGRRNAVRLCCRPDGKQLRYHRPVH